MQPVLQNSEEENVLVHPIPLEDLPVNVKVFPRKSGGWSYVIGTAHVSHVSVEHVKDLIHTVHPDTVVIELCKGRLGVLLQQEEQEKNKDEESVWKKFGDGVKNKNGSQIFHILLARAVSSMTADLKIESGSELRAAAVEGMKIGARIILGDRPIGITFKRTWARLSFWEKTKILFTCLYVLVVGMKIDAEEVEKIKNGDFITEMVEELASKYPGTTETIINERDKFLTGSLRDCPGNIVVGVVGLGHLSGIETYWDKEIDRLSLLTVPESKKSNYFRYITLTVAGAISIGSICVIKYLFY